MEFDDSCDDDAVFLDFEAADASERELTSFERNGKVTESTDSKLPPVLASENLCALANEALIALRPASSDERSLLNYDEESLLHFAVWQRDADIVGYLAAFVSHGSRPLLIRQLNDHFARSHRRRYGPMRWCPRGFSGSDASVYANQRSMDAVNVALVTPLKCLSPMMTAAEHQRDWLVKVELVSVSPIRAFAPRPAATAATDSGQADFLTAHEHIPQTHGRRLRPQQMVSCIVRDQLGDEAPVIFFNAALTKFFPILHPGRVYYMGSGRVTVWKTARRAHPISITPSPILHPFSGPSETTTHFRSPYTIVLNALSIVHLCPPDEPLQVKAELPTALM